MVRDQPHYLKPLKTTSTPKRLMWLACSSTTARKRDHYEATFNAAALGRTHWTAKTCERKDTVDLFDDPVYLWNEVAKHCPVGRRVVMFTWDLAEQIRVSQMLTHLVNLDWTVDRIVLEKAAAWCLLRNGKRSLMCCDLRSWTPVAWSKINTDAPVTADDSYTFAAGETGERERLICRMLTIRNAVLQIFDWIEGENLGQFRPTGSGQSYAAFRRRFMAHRLLVHDDAARLDAERRAMHTGRAEAWRHGTCRSGPYCEYDLRAAYATIARDSEPPAMARGQLRKPSTQRILTAMRKFAVLADVTVTTRVECLPFKVDRRTMWPVGTFTTTVWDPELMLALEYCDHVRINHAWLYTRAPALQQFATYVLGGLSSGNLTYGVVPQRVLKHWSRCLVGRLGLRYRSWVRFGPQIPPDVRLLSYEDLDDGTRTDMLAAGHDCFLLGDMSEATESLPQIPGWIMSECRARLYRAMINIGLRHVVYVDTDSIIVAPAGRHGMERHDQAHAGETWAVKGTYGSLEIHGPRNLHVGADRRISGIPLSATQSAPLEYSGEVMQSVKRSMRNGEMDLVVSMPRTFHMVTPDLRRRHMPDGLTAPYKVEAA